MFSPDGNYIVNLSDKAGPYGIYVRPFPDVQSREWTIPARGGYDARWSPAHDQILYRVGETRFMSVPYTLEPEFTPGSERLVLETEAHDSAGFSFDLSADGERFLVDKPSISHSDPRPVLMVTDAGPPACRLQGPRAEPSSVLTRYAFSFPAAQSANDSRSPSSAAMTR